MESIHLIDVTSDNWLKVCKLHPGKEGADFVASNSFSIAQSVYEKSWVIKGIAMGDTLIGFTMYGLDEDSQKYTLCRFMLDQSYQGKGYGKEALQVILAEMRSSYGCNEVYLSTSPNNHRGKHLYQKASFVPTGETCGEGEGIEEVFCLKF